MDEEKILKSIDKVQNSLNGLIETVSGIQQELSSFKKETREDFTEVKEGIKELKATANVTDKILEQHPIERIERIETTINLPMFVPTVSEE
ncbi:MAG TPA: hypothetical protein VJJ22_02720 [Candidatus Paceibacterota bacterium]